MSWRETHYASFDPMNRVQGTLWLGLGEDAGDYLWYDNNLSKWYISAYIGPRVQIDSTVCTGYWYSYNSNRYWYGDGLYLWYSSAYSMWVLSDKLGACFYEAWDEDAGEYTGNTWWSGSSLEGRYEARGAGRGTTAGAYEGTARNVTLEVEGWERGTPYTGTPTPPAGRYYYYKRTASVDGAGVVSETVSTTVPAGTDTHRDVGYLTWGDQTGGVYPRSTVKLGSQYTYGNIYYDMAAGSWVIGVVDSEEGWYEGAEPDYEAPVVFERKKTGTGDYPGPVDLTVSLTATSLGDSQTEVLLAEAGLWC